MVVIRVHRFAYNGGRRGRVDLQRAPLRMRNAVQLSGQGSARRHRIRASVENVGGFRVLGFRFRGFGLKVLASGFRVFGFLGFGFLGFWVSGFLGFWVSGFSDFWGFWVFGYLGFGVLGFGVFEFLGFGFWVLCTQGYVACSNHDECKNVCQHIYKRMSIDVCVVLMLFILTYSVSI